MDLENALKDFLLTNNVATEDEIELVTDINGYNEQSFLDILFARTGTRDIEQAYDNGAWVTNELLDYYGIEK